MKMAELLPLKEYSFTLTFTSSSAAFSRLDNSDFTLSYSALMLSFSFCRASNSALYLTLRSYIKQNNERTRNVTICNKGPLKAS